MTDKDSIGIIIKDQSTGPYFCNSDNFRLTLQDKRTGEHLCSRCGTSYFPNLGEKVKRANKFEVPSGRDKMPLVSLAKDSNIEPSTVYKQPKLSPFFKEFLASRPGVKITHYETSED